MIKNKKQMFIAIGSFLLMLVLFTTSYAFFNYIRTGGDNSFNVGRVYFISRNEQTINLSNMFPIDPETPGIMNDPTQVGTYSIEIQGDSDYEEGLEYLVSVVDSNITTSSGKTIPISLNITVTNLGTEEPDYFTERESKDTTIYKKLVEDSVTGDQKILVGFIKPNTTAGTAEGVNGSITIKAYLDQNNVAISDTYYENAPTPTPTASPLASPNDEYGTTDEWVDGRVVLTTTEWNALSQTGLSFKIKVEANEGLWVSDNPLESMMRSVAVMDNINSEFVNNATPGIDFGAVSGDTNGKGVYIRAGTENDAHPILYYRGAVTDNNVVFANYCWKIVRTTDTGGVKLIFNGQNSGTETDPTCTYTGYEVNAKFTVANKSNIKYNTDKTSITLVGYMHGEVISNTINYEQGNYYGSSFSWNGTSYSLVDATVTTPDNTHHYSCFSTDPADTCNELYYVFENEGPSKPKYYITLTGGDDVDETLNKLHVNTYDSNIKSQIDTWYATNLASYTNKLEDTIYCNDRSMYYRGHGFNPSGYIDEDDYQKIVFGAYQRSNFPRAYFPYNSPIKNQPSLVCPNKRDSFTVDNSNGNQKLTYPIAMITTDEVVLAGGISNGDTSTTYMKSNYYFWTMSPAYTNPYNDAVLFYVTHNVQIKATTVDNNSTYVRPVISLKPGFKIAKGTGITTDPYVIE